MAASTSWTAAPLVSRVLANRRNVKNKDWSRDEHILALDFYLRHKPHIPGKTSTEVIALSELLNRLQDKLGGPKTETFRNPSGIYMKLMNFRRFDPAYKGAGLANGNKDEEVVWGLYAKDPAKLTLLGSTSRALQVIQSKWSCRRFRKQTMKTRKPTRGQSSAVFTASVNGAEGWWTGRRHSS
jgi:predicted HNH restriction endonuclease